MGSVYHILVSPHANIGATYPMYDRRRRQQHRSPFASIAIFACIIIKISIIIIIVVVATITYMVVVIIVVVCP